MNEMDRDLIPEEEEVSLFFIALNEQYLKAVAIQTFSLSAIQLNLMQ